MDLLNLKCSNCIYYKGLYIHPVSKVPEELKRSRNGFTCLLTCDAVFMENDPDSHWVDVHIGSKDGGGCECFTDKANYKLIVTLEKKENE